MSPQRLERLGHRKQADRLLLTLFDHLPAMVAYWDRDARNVVANAAYLEWFGRDPNEMHGCHISEILGPEVYAKNLPYISAALAGEEQLFDRTLVDQSGRTRHTQASYIPDIVDGDVRGFFVLVTDVTPRVEAQRAAEEAQELANLGSWELEPATGEVTWSRQLFAIIGLQPGKVEPNIATLSQFVHPDDRDRVLANIERSIRHQESYTNSYRIVRTDGEIREVVSKGRPTVDQTGRVVRLSGTLQDVTEANVAARELAATNAELIRANRLNSDVLAMLGHDIRTPIAAVRGFLELLEDADQIPAEQQRRLLGKVQDATLRLGKMVDRILALAAVDSGTIEATEERVEIAAALQAAAEALDLDAPPEIRMAPDAPVAGVFDAVHFDQIISNLLVNAHRYGAEPIDIDVAAAGAGMISVAVSDAGPGVAPEARASLFTRFARTGASQRAQRGTGLGLYLSAQLAEANHAELTYRPATEGRPHAFVLTLPAC